MIDAALFHMRTNHRYAGQHNGRKSAPVRYAVVGLGYVSQVAVLPAFAHARGNSRLTALISDDPAKLRLLGDKYGAEHRYSYDEYDDALRSGYFDAIYIALPNSMHCDFTIRAARAGIHVLCEKPMAVTPAECRRMIRAAKVHDIRLMIAYRLHFEAANLKAVALARSGEIGDLRIFNSLFTMSVKHGDIRVKRSLGGGTLFDIGIYCINAARYLFGGEPYEVFAWSANNGERRFHEVDEMTAAVLRFPGERLASFTSSFGSADTSTFQLVGTKGHVRLDPAYELAESLRLEATVGGKHRTHNFQKRDQFAPELIHFSACVQSRAAPAPSGEEGLADVRVIEALYESARLGRPVAIQSVRRRRRPSPDQEIHRPPVRRPVLFRARRPSRAPSD